MNKDQRILELQQKINRLEAERNGLQVQLQNVVSVFNKFQTQYSSVTTEMSTKLATLSNSIQSLRNELAVLASSEVQSTPVQPTPVKEETPAPKEEFSYTPAQAEKVEDKTVEEHIETVKAEAAYEACVSDMNGSVTLSDLKKETPKSQPVQEPVSEVKPQETVAPEPVKTTVQTPAQETVKETSQAEIKKETQQPVQTATQEAAKEPVKTQAAQQTTTAQQTSGAQQTANATAQQRTQTQQQTGQKTQQKPQQQTAASQTQEESIFDKISKVVDWEKFIGENLIMKLGILIVLIGVAIGGKYAIDHQLLSPAMRMIIGTLFGAALQGVAIKLKKEYKTLSAVLASGAMAILYFMTLFSYNLYDLIPLPVAFVLMTLITVATVWQACIYDMEVIAVIGLVAAYVIPFALSTGEGGSPWILFSYISIINAGVMFIAVKRYWKILFVSAFVSTSFILGFVYRVKDFTATSDSVKMLAFLFAHFAIFYTTFLAYKVRRSLIFQYFDINFLLYNSFLFFGLGYNVMYNNASLAPYVALFTIFNAVVHAAVAFVLIKKDIVDKSVSRMITGLAISFLTIAILVWMTGHWLTMFWMLEGTVLFTVSRVSKRPFYEKMAYPVLFLALVSLIIDWGNPNGGHLSILTPMFDAFARYRAMWDVSTAAVQGSALSIVNTLMFIALSIFLAIIDHRYPIVETEETQNSLMKLFASCLKVMAVFVVTTAILVHIERPWLTMAWILEATALFAFSRKKKLLSCEKLSYPVFVLALFSLFADWGNPNQPNLDFFYIWYHLLAYNNTAEIFRVNIEAVDGSIVNYGFILSIINSVLFVVLSIFASIVAHRYPLAENEETKDSWARIASQWQTGMTILVLTLAFLVHVDQPWLSLCWLAETVALCYIGRTKNESVVEIGSYVVVAFSTVAFLHEYKDQSYYDFLYRIELGAHSFSMHIVEIWKSLVAGLALAVSIIGNVWVIRKFKVSSVTDKLGIEALLERYLVIVLAFIIWTHTPWVITTMLYFALAFACMIWTLRYDGSQKIMFCGVFALAMLCWGLEVCWSLKDSKTTVMLLSSVVCVALVYLIWLFNNKPEYEKNRISTIPFSAILETMPFIALASLIWINAKDWTTCYVIAYFAVWTLLSLKLQWNSFKSYSFACLILAILVKLYLGVFKLVIDDIPSEITVLHFVTLATVLFAGWVIYTYKKQEKSMFGLDEPTTTMLFDSFVFFGSVIVVGNELNNICRFVGYPGAFGVVFSVFLGVVSLFGIYYGLFKDKKYLRIEGFTLLGFTLLKLFFYDMKHFDTIYKTIAFVSLGLLMIVMSYFYQKIAKEKAKEKANEKAQSQPIAEEHSAVETQNVEEVKVEAPTAEANSNEKESKTEDTPKEIE